MINYDIIFSGVEFGIPKAASDWPCVCVFVLYVCVQHTTGYPKDFYPCDDPISFLEDAAKRFRGIRGLVCLTIVCILIVSDD